MTDVGPSGQLEAETLEHQRYWFDDDAVPAVAEATRIQEHARPGEISVRARTE
ncbi:hypothetical protein [Pseudofrankia inefficax]|uniref:Uncharacterized protein n=1 Tax=Pseudofrankia inefficax (strain DSM 45817 / CECT 9037 / DDB 130130 / EuI1c) TaxID=298654 RepID=E3IZD2_PSEI1|nr:hypothetical protein [Pseudofrankia inefficax]ADP81559.1 hypothetical protein FraEuI1c_3552 [Pseudofrankia inefficax]